MRTLEEEVDFRFAELFFDEAIELLEEDGWSKTAFVIENETCLRRILRQQIEGEMR